MNGLVVDDNEIVLDVVARVLRGAGHRVLVARDLASARRIGSRERLRIDLLVTDVEMPDGSGFDLADNFAALRPEIPVVWISGGYLQRDREVHTRIRPGRVFVEKPFTIPALMAAIAQATGAMMGRCACAGS